VVRGGHAKTERGAEKETSEYQEVGECSRGVAG
jgi:hypothetical protein